MYRSLITAATLLTLVSAPALAATSGSTPPKAAHAMSKPVKPAGKQTIASHGAKTHRLAKTTNRHIPKSNVKAMPSKAVPPKSAS
jgi:hypothetical protein